MESLEVRQMLSGALAGVIPNSIDIANATDMLFATDRTTRSISAQSGGTTSQYYRFAQDAEAQAPTVFSIASAEGMQGMTALALYDENGNLVQLMDDQELLGREEMSANIDPRRAYVLGIFTQGTPATYALQVETPSQLVNPTLRIDPTAGTATSDPSAPQNVFSTSADVDYYPLDFTNAGASGTVTVTPIDAAVRARVAVYRRQSASEAWTLIAAGGNTSSNPVTFNVTPMAGKHLTDAQYMLAVAPVDLTAPAGAYRVNLSAGSLLGPGTISPPATFPILPPVSPGVAGLNFSGQLAQGGRVLNAFTVPVAGPLTIKVKGTGVAPVVSLFDGQGQVIKVSSRTDAGEVVMTYAAAQGQRLVVAAGDVGNDQAGAVEIGVTTASAPTEVNNASGVLNLGQVTFDANRPAASFRLNTPAGADAMLLEVANSNAGLALKAVIVGPDMAPIEMSAAAGQKLVFPAVIQGKSGPFDVTIMSTSGSGTVTVRAGAWSVLEQLSPNTPSLAPQTLGISGQMAPFTQSAPAFGNFTGGKFYQLLTADNAPAHQLSVTGIGGAIPFLMHFEDAGTGQMQLKALVAPTINGGNATASLTTKLAGRRVHGLAAVSMSLDGGGSFAFSYTGPQAAAVGIGMVPDPPPPAKPWEPNIPFPNPNPQPGTQYFAQMSVRKAVLEQSFQRDYWETRFPNNITSSPVVTLTRNAGSAFVGTVRIFRADGSLLHQFSNSGDTASVTLSMVSFSEFKNQKLRFEVEASTLGDGMYTLEMRTPMSDPSIYEIGEIGFREWGTNPPGAPSGLGVIPKDQDIVDIIQNQYGDGSVTGTFTSAGPYNRLTVGGVGDPGAIDVYRFWALSEGQVRVRAVALDDTVDTNIRLYKAHFNGSGQVDYLIEHQELTAAYDWFQIDRDVIDAQAIVNDWDMLEYNSFGAQYVNAQTSGGMYFVVVKNAGGSLGNYRLEVETPDFPRLGDAGNPSVPTYGDALVADTTVLSQTGDNTRVIDMRYIEKIDDFVGYFPIQLPGYRTTLTAQSPAGVVNMEFDMFDENGTLVPSALTTFIGQITRTFNVPEGTHSVFLRVRETGNITQANGFFTVTSDVTVPFSPAPSVILPATPDPRALKVNPFGDAKRTFAEDGSVLSDERQFDSITTGQVKAFKFRGKGERLTISVAPADVTTTRVQWAVYADGLLVAWDRTRMLNGQAVLSSLTRAIELPNQEAYQDIVLLVNGISAPAGGGQFSIEVETEAPSIALPTATFNVLGINPTITFTTTGAQWRHIVVPDHTAGGTTFTVDAPIGGISITTVFWEVINRQGAKFSGSVSIDLLSGSATLSVPQMTKGSDYYVRFGVVANANTNVDVQARVTMSKAAGNKPAAQIDFDTDRVRLAFPSPDGKFSSSTSQFNDSSNANVKESMAFWVDQPGVATFRGKFPTTLNGTTVADAVLAVYRTLVIGNEFPDYELQLVDYANSLNLSADGYYTLSVYLQRGSYVLKGFRNSTGTVYSQVEAQLPAYIVEDVVLHPVYGTSAQDDLQGIDDAGGGTSVMESFRTHFYRVVAPDSSLGDWSISALSLNDSQFNEENGSARMTAFRQLATGTFSKYALSAADSTINPVVGDPQTYGKYIEMPADALAGNVYYVGLNRLALATKMGVGVTFDVPQSGTPDIVVDEVKLLPNNGSTKVEVTLRNRGYAPAGLSYAKNTISDSSTFGIEVWKLHSERQITSINARGKEIYSFVWNPLAPSDDVKVEADIRDDVDEITNANNVKQRELSEVDAHRPTVVLQLADPSLDGNQDANLWGRYIQDVYTPIDVQVVASDTDGDLYQVVGQHPVKMANNHGPHTTGTTYVGEVYGSNYTWTSNDFNMGHVAPTNANTPNLWTAKIVDAYGLASNVVTKTVQVVAFPKWLDGNSSEISFNPDSKGYDIDFKVDFLKYDKTLAQEVGSVPFIGDKRNAFIAEVYGGTLASLNPANAVNLPITGHLQFTLMGADVLNETHHSGDGDISTTMLIDPVSLAADQFNVGMVVDVPDIVDYHSPEIPLFSYGVEGVASISANLSFSLNAGLKAGLAIGMRQDGSGYEVGLAKPTFVQPNASAGLHISGDVEFFGWDIASLEGAVYFDLALTYGLKTAAPHFVKFGDFFSNDGFNLSGQLRGEITADVLGVEVFSVELGTIPLIDAGDDVATSFAGGPTPGQPALPDPSEYLTYYGGNTTITRLIPEAAPSLLIDPVTGRGLFTQLSSVGGINALNFARRLNGVWQPAATLSSAAHLNKPLSARTNDGSNSPAVVVYQAFNGDPVGQTRNAYFAGQNLRYRYFDGTNWSPEQVLTNDQLFDGYHSVAFNSAGQGALVWVRNKNATPVSDQGGWDGASNEIMYAAWNPATHSWGAPVALTDDSAHDSQPTVQVANDGTVLVAWTRGEGSSKEIVYQVIPAGGSSGPLAAPAGPAQVLPMLGLPAGGTISNLVLGSDAAGNVTLLFSHALTHADKRVESRLFSRTTTMLNFSQPAGLVEVARNAQFAGVELTNAPDGKLVAYWQNSLGRDSDIFAAKLNGAQWDKATRVTGGAEIESNPSLAIDTDGKYQLVFDQRDPQMLEGMETLPWGTSLPAVQIGGLQSSDLVGSNVVQGKPELGFFRAFNFANADKAPVGSQIIGDATIINTGGPAQVLIEYLDLTSGQVVLGSQTVTLKAGAKYEIRRAFTVGNGPRSYGVRISPVGNSEALGSADNLSTATLQGLPDIAVASVVTDKLNPQAGDLLDVKAVVKNVSNVALSNVRVVFYLEDPSNPAVAPKVIGEKIVNLASLQTLSVSIPWTVPADGAAHVIRAVADVGDAVKESSETNNNATDIVKVKGDAVIRSQEGPAFSAEVLNESGVDNIRVRGFVHNAGSADLANVAVHLYWSRKNGAFELVGSTTLASLARGQYSVVQFIVDGLAGENRYQLVIDPDGKLPEADRTNNVSLTSVTLQGTPDITPDKVMLSSSAVRGRPLKLLTTLKNLGIEDAEDVLVEVLARPIGGAAGSTGGLVVGRMTLAKLAALASQDVAIPLDTSKLIGSVLLTLMIDRNLDLVELSDSNNSASIGTTFVASRPEVSARKVFYNNSALDSQSDDDAIDTTKSALLPGQKAAAANFTSYFRGINGVIIDTWDMPGTPTVADFVFRAGNNANPETWALAPAPASITFRTGEGVDGSDRITIVWADNRAIRNQWLQVMLKANAVTGLGAADVFYFGNLIADATGDAKVDHLDFAEVKSTMGRTGTTVLAADFNADGKVTFADFQSLELGFGKSLIMLDAPSAGASVNESAPAPAPVTKKSPPVPTRKPVSRFATSASAIRALTSTDEPLLSRRNAPKAVFT
jgi:hypothetical protein